jgi:hypothetical protein
LITTTTSATRTPTSTSSTPTSTTYGCTYVWTTYANSQWFDGQSVRQRTVSGCQQACIGVSNCSGIDWDSILTDVGLACWLLGPWSSGYEYGRAYGVTHYELTRIGPGC